MDERNVNTTNKETVAEDWCKKSLPELARFNRVFVRRKGKGFSRVVVLQSENQDDIQFSFDKEQAYFSTNGWNCVLSNTHNVPNSNTLLFRTKAKDDEVYNAFDVSGISDLYDTQKLLAVIVDEIGFIDLTEEFLKKVHPGCLQHLLSKVSEFGVERFVNDLVMNHYNVTESDYMIKDDVLSLFGTTLIIDDKKWTPDGETSVLEEIGLEPTLSESIREINSAKQRPQETNTPVPKPQIPKDSVDKHSVHAEASKQSNTGNKEVSPLPYEEKINSHSITSSKGLLGNHGKFRPLKSESNNEKAIEQKKTNGKPQLNTKTKKDDTIPEPNREKQMEKTSGSELNVAKDDVIAKEQADVTLNPTPDTIEKNNDMPPAPVKAKKISFQSKETLSEEEKEENAKLLHNIRSVYEETLQFVRELHSPQFAVFVNLLNEALNGNKYTKQLCPVYLDITDDLTTDLYAKLYDLDKITSEFNKKLVHQVIHIGCPFCANEWDEDITFAYAGMHYTRCPKCGKERPYMKEE